MKVTHIAWMGFAGIISGSAVAGDIIKLDSCCHVGGISGGQSVDLSWDVPVDISPTTINLKCDTSGTSTGKDSGVIGAALSNDPSQGFYLEKLDNLDDTSPGGYSGDPIQSPLLVPFIAGGANDPLLGDSYGTPITKVTFTYDTDGTTITGAKLFYYSCRADGTGLAQLINTLSGGLLDNGTVDLAVVGLVTTSAGSTPLISVDLDHETTQ